MNVNKNLEFYKCDFIMKWNCYTKIILKYKTEGDNKDEITLHMLLFLILHSEYYLKQWNEIVDINNFG